MLVSELLADLDKRAPLRYAEDWDNVGLLVGDPSARITGVVTSIELTDAALDRAVEQKANVVITHHPIMFRPLRNLQFHGRFGDASLIKRLISEDVNHISMHTNFDRSPDALHSYLFSELGINNGRPLEDHPDGNGSGYGIIGEFSKQLALSDLLKEVAEKFEVKEIRTAGPTDKSVRKVAMVTGTGMFMYERARALGADCFITGDLKYHEAVQAKYDGIAVIDVGHFGAEKHFCRVMRRWVEEISAPNVTDFMGIDPFNATFIKT